MSIAGQLTRPCTIRHRPVLDEDPEVNEYGDPVPGAPIVVETFCEIQQRQRDEGDDQGELSDTRWLLVLAAGEQIGSADTVVVDGQAFELVGDPWPVWDRLVGAADHIEATVRRTA